MKDLRSTGRLLVESQVEHVDKFCPRSHKQLIQRAVSSWFIRVSDTKNLEPTNWVPLFVKEKRFTNWVANAHDWNVSRNRYWGTPIPLWVSDDYEDVVCVGSVEELKRFSSFDGPLDDLHREKVDGMTIPFKQGKGFLHRVDEIFDCWFESESMPYASVHFPFENSEQFHTGLFPADFIAEGLDQTRGWFYTLTVLGNKLFSQSPFKNVIVNGIVLEETGKKMSKSLGNSPDPNGIIGQYGSDALRLYLINSPVVRGEPINFSEAEVKRTVARVLLPLWNSYRFFHEQTVLYKSTIGQDFSALTSFGDNSSPVNIMDRWILADCQTLLHFVDEEMQAYRLYTVVPRLSHSLDNLTNWYIHFNRKRPKGAAGHDAADTTTALSTLLQVLFTLVRALAPFIPFLTEHIYQLLRPVLPASVTSDVVDARSVHFLPFPTAQTTLLDEAVERQVAAMQKVIQLGQAARERCGVGLKTPLRTLVVIADAQVLVDMNGLMGYVQEELNVRDVVLSEDEERYGIRLEVRVDWPSLGKKLRGSVQVVRKALPGLSQGMLREYQRTGRLDVDGIALGEGDLTLVWVVGKGEEEGTQSDEGSHKDGLQWEPGFSDDMIVLLDAAVHPELLEEGLMREFVNLSQRLRKKAGLAPTDEVLMRYRVVSDPDTVGLSALVAARQDTFVAALHGRVGVRGALGGEDIILEEEQSVGNAVVVLQLGKL